MEQIKESWRRDILMRILRCITEFETECLHQHHNCDRLQANLAFAIVWAERMESKTRRGLVYANPLKNAANNFFGKVDSMLKETMDNDEATIQALEAKVFEHFAEVISHIRDAELLQKDAEREHAAATN